MSRLLENLKKLENFFQPKSPEKAVLLLEEYKKSRPIAGGTDLVLKEKAEAVDLILLPTYPKF